MNTSLKQFDDHIIQNSLLTHYFYKVKWNEGELTKEELAAYAKEYFHLAKRIPGIVARVYDRALERHPELAESIEHNMAEETEHIDLWKKFGNSLGITDKEMEKYEPTETVKNAVREMEKLAEGSFEDGVAVMYALELDLPRIAQSKKDGLVRFYGLTSKDAHIYFDEHLNEENHFEVWRRIDIDPAKAKPVIDKCLAAQHKVLDGVCEACDMEICAC